MHDSSISKGTKTYPRKILLNLDGLRGVGALIVIFAHLLMCFIPSWGDYINTSLLDYPRVIRYGALILATLPFNGALAVAIFWVMSSYVLAYAYYSRLESRMGEEYLKSATLRRYPRLMIPVFISVIFSYSLHQFGFYSWIGEVAGGTAWLKEKFQFDPSLGKAVYQGLWGALFFYKGEQTYNEVLWTMEKEMYGSILLFAYLFCLRKVRWPADFVFIALLILLNNEYVLCFYAGLLLVKYKKSLDLHLCAKPKQTLALVSAALSVATIPFVDLLWLQSSVIVCAVLYCPILKVLFSSFPRFLAKWSFSVYLIHIPVMASLGCWVYIRCGWSQIPAAILMAVATICVSYFLAMLLYRVCDEGLIKLVNHRINRLLTTTK